MTTRWRRVAEAIRDRREVLGLSRPQLALRAGGEPGIVSASTVKNLEGARDYDRPTAHALLVERALGWAPGSIDTILLGGEPTLLPEANGASAGPVATGAESVVGSRQPPYTIDRDSGVVIYKWDELGRPTALFILVDEGRAISEAELDELVGYMKRRKRRQDAQRRQELRESQRADNRLVDENSD